jgi:E3 ubiquitin-protein ligase SIS3
MIRVPDWAFEAAGQETRGMGQDAAAYQPGLYLTPAQVVLVNVSRPVDFILEVMQSSI